MVATHGWMHRVLLGEEGKERGARAMIMMGLHARMHAARRFQPTNKHHTPAQYAAPVSR